jgi:hypothetical protein
MQHTTIWRRRWCGEPSTCQPRPRIQQRKSDASQQPGQQRRGKAVSATPAPPCPVAACLALLALALLLLVWSTIEEVCVVH